MAAVRGIFSLNRVQLKRFTNEWTNLSDVWIDQLPNTGYFGGGFSPTTPGVVSSMNKINYAYDTVIRVPSCNLNSPIRLMGSSSSLTVGYFGGGEPGGISRIDKLTYSIDTIASVPGVNLSLGRNNLSASGNATVGYFGGGFSPSLSNYVTTMDKLTYSTDTTTAITNGALSFSAAGRAATGSTTAGYFGGGRNVIVPGSYSTIDKLTYSTDTKSTISPFVTTRFDLSATSSSTAGYFSGGFVGPFTFFESSLIDKLSYSTDTYSSDSRLRSNRFDASASSSSTSGYFYGGYNDDGLPGSGVDIPESNVEKISYTTDLTSFATTITSPIVQTAATSARNNHQFLWRRFSDGTTTTNPASIPQATPTPQTTSGNSPDVGYFGGGFIFPAIYFSRMDKLTYSTDTTVYTPTTNLTIASRRLAATGSPTAGYFGGGNTPSTSFISKMDKLIYSVDVTVGTPSANLSVGRDGLAATGNSTTGYFGGGATPTTASRMDKLSYSTDTTVFTPTANLSAARFVLAATGSSTAGYFGGGDPGPVSTMDKVTYATDTTASIPSANLSASRSNLAATGSSTAGYFGGGSAAPGLVSTMDKLIYSTDTTTALFGGLSAARGSLAATGNSTAGYFGGGNSPGVSRMDKLTYSTDTTVFTPTANLSASRYNLAASSATANALPSSAPAPVLV
jgi:hypothetical protein